MITGNPIKEDESRSEPPIVTMDPPARTNFSQICGIVRSVIRTKPMAILFRDRIGFRLSHDFIQISANSSIRENQHIELALQVPCIQCLRINELKGKLILFEQPAGPSGRDQAAVLVI